MASRNRTSMVVSVVMVVVIASLWWHHRGNRPVPSTKPVAHDHAGSARAQQDAPKLDAKPAHVDVMVSDDKGPLAGATVRLVDDEGEVTLAATGKDGHARSEAPAGSYRVSASAPDHAPASAKARELHADEAATFELVLAHGGRTLSGLVTDASGGPIGGARIDASRIDGMAHPGDAVASTLTAADGKYTLTVAEGQLLVAASDPDYAPQSRYVEVGATGGTANFQLVPGGVIEGIVRDEKTRDPVGGVVIAQRDAGTLRLGERARHRAVAGADGKFRLTGLRPGSYELGAAAGRRVSRAPTIVGLGVAEQVADVEILVTGTAAVRGVVVDETGAPMPGITVAAFDDDAEATSGPKGEFELTGLAPGPHELHGRGPDVIPMRPTHIELGADDLDGVRVTVRHGLTIAGHVEPRQECEVRLEFASHRMGMGEMPMLVSPATSGADGEFKLGPVGVNEYMLDAHCTSGDQGSLAVTTAPGMAAQIIHVTPGGAIAGHVVDTQGKAVGGVIVMAEQQTGGVHTTIVNGRITSGVQAITDRAGAFEVKGLAAGTYQMRVLDRGKPLPMRTPEAAATVTVAAAARKTGVELAVDRADGVIRGTVVDGDGKPLADAWVSVHQDFDAMIANMAKEQGSAAASGSRMITVQASDDGDAAGDTPPALTDATGHFEIGGLTRDPWDVIAEAKAGKLRGRATGIVPDATIKIQTADLTELRGVVHASAPLVSFSVELEGPTRATRSFANADGSFSFARVDPGDYTVHVTSPAGNGEGSVHVTAGAPATVEITLASNAVVIGKLVDPDGKPLPDLAVTVVPDTGSGMRIQLEGPPPTSGPDGTFRVETKAGKSTLVVLVPPRPVTKPGILLEAGKTVDVGTITVATAAGTPHKP